MVPASRFRCEQFFGFFEENGVRCQLRYAYGQRYNSVIHHRWSSSYKFLCRLKRGFHQVMIPKEADIVFLQRTAFPHFPGFEFLLSQRNLPVVFDFDDNLTVNGAGDRSLARETTFELAASWANQLIAGNQFLADQAARPEKTAVIPTVIDTQRYVPVDRPNQGKVIIGWMGTSGNFPSLLEIVPTLSRVLKANPDTKVRIVSNATFLPFATHPQVEQIPWTSANEISLLQSFDIGLMPLVDSLLTRGKCAFKMIQYMAVGCPVVVSAVGANVEVFGNEGEPSGYLQKDFDWDEALEDLIRSRTKRLSMGQNGRNRVESNYSIDAVAPRYLEIFDRLLQNHR